MGSILLPTVDDWNPKQPPGMVLKPYKSWDKLPINWCRISTASTHMTWKIGDLQYLFVRLKGRPFHTLRIMGLSFQGISLYITGFLVCSVHLQTTSFEIPWFIYNPLTKNEGSFTTTTQRCLSTCLSQLCHLRELHRDMHLPGGNGGNGGWNIWVGSLVFCACFQSGDTVDGRNPAPPGMTH